MGVGMVALALHSLNLLLVVLFLLAMQANFFSPAKYGILPEMLDEAQLTRANGLLELSTFAAIVLGTSVGSFLFARWKGEPLDHGRRCCSPSPSSDRSPASSSARSRLRVRTDRFSGIRSAKSGPARSAFIATARCGSPSLGISYFWFVGALFQMTVILTGTRIAAPVRHAHGTAGHRAGRRHRTRQHRRGMALGRSRSKSDWCPIGAAAARPRPPSCSASRIPSRSSRGLAGVRGIRRRTLHRAAERFPAGPRRARRKGPAARHQQFLEYDRSGAGIRRALSVRTTSCAGHRAHPGRR